MRGLTAGLIGAGLLLATAASTALAAPPPFCRGYASAALNQVRVAGDPALPGRPGRGALVI